MCSLKRSGENPFNFSIYTSVFYFFFLFSFIILNFSDVLFSHSLHLSILYNVFNIFYLNISLQLVSVVDRYENIYFGHI